MRLPATEAVLVVPIDGGEMQLDPNEFVDFKIHLGLRPFHDVDNGLKIDIRNVNFWYGTKHALKDVSLRIYDREVIAFIGPSGCGKTTLLRCLNRSHDMVPGARLTGAPCRLSIRARLRGRHLQLRDKARPHAALARRARYLNHRGGDPDAEAARQVTTGEVLGARARAFGGQATASPATVPPAISRTAPRANGRQGSKLSGTLATRTTFSALSDTAKGAASCAAAFGAHDRSSSHRPGGSIAPEGCLRRSAWTQRRPPPA